MWCGDPSGRGCRATVCFQVDKVLHCRRYSSRDKSRWFCCKSEFECRVRACVCCVCVRACVAAAAAQHFGVRLWIFVHYKRKPCSARPYRSDSLWSSTWAIRRERAYGINAQTYLPTYLPCFVQFSAWFIYPVTTASGPIVRKMAAQIKPGPSSNNDKLNMNRKPVLLAKIEGCSDNVNKAVYIPDTDGVISVSSDR